MNNPIMYSDPSGHIAIWAAALIGEIISLAVEFVVDYFEDYSGTIDHSFLDYFGAGVSGAISGGFGSSTNVLFRLGGAVLGSVAQGAIAENVDYNLGSLKRDLIIGLASFGISEYITIMGKKLLRGWFNKAANNTTKNASKQLHQLINERIVNNLKPNAQKILSRVKLYGNLLSFGEKSVGALYSFITSMNHSTIINW